MENEPSINLGINGESYEARRDNTTLFTFLGKVGINLSMYNHIFYRTKEEDGTASGFYIWDHNPVFNELAQFMIDNGYPAYLNMPKVPQCDLDAFDRTMEASSDFDTLPSEWQ